MRPYTVLLEYDPEAAAYSVTVPASPGCTSMGGTGGRSVDQRPGSRRGTRRGAGGTGRAGARRDDRADARRRQRRRLIRRHSKHDPHGFRLAIADAEHRLGAWEREKS